MALPGGVAPPADGAADIAALDRSNAAQMLALTGRAMPDYFRRRTPALGSYCGIRIDGELVAMAGERLVIDRHVEISGVCTHPDHRGRGYASGLIWQLVRQHRRQGLVSWLHVSHTNYDAIALYRRMGFRVFNRVVLQKVARG